MKKSHSIIFSFLAVFVIFRAGDANTPLWAQTAAYQIPTIIYVGDKGRLVYPLDAFFSQHKNAEVGEVSDAIAINKLSISNGRLLVDFQAFRTGTVRLPPIIIGDEKLVGLEVHISSVLDESGDLSVLSPAAAPISAPGTLPLIAGFTLLILLIIAFIFLFVFRGGTFFTQIKRILHCRRILRLTEKKIKKLKIALDKQIVSPGGALTSIVNELRTFLDSYFQIHCRSMAPPEFLEVKFPENSGLDEKYSVRYFYDFFMNCDNMRFSGCAITDEAVSGIIDEVEKLVKSIHLPTTTGQKALKGPKGL